MDRVKLTVNSVDETGSLGGIGALFESRRTAVRCALAWVILVVFLLPVAVSAASPVTATSVPPREDEKPIRVHAGAQGDAGVVHIGKGDWAPYVCHEHADSGLPGYAVDILETVYRQAGYGVQVTSLSYARGIRRVRDGDVTIMACMHRKDAPDLVYPSVPLGRSVNRFFVWKDNPWRLDGAESLAGLRVGLVKGYRYPEFQEYIDSHTNNFVYIAGEKPLRRILKMVQAGRLDAAFEDRQVARHEARAIGLDGELVDAGGFGVENDVLVGFSPIDARTPRLVRLLDGGMRDLRRSGELARILERYGLQDWDRRPELTVAVTHRPPWTVVGEDGVIRGLDINIVRAIGERLGVTLKFEAYPWKRCVAMLEQGRVDVITRFSRTREREKFAVYITPPYGKEEMVFLVRRGSAVEVRRYEDLYGKRVGVIRGNAYTPRFDADSRIDKAVVDGKSQLFRMLLSGRIDVVVGFDRPVLYDLAVEGLEDAVSVCPLRLERDDADHFAMSRKSPHAALAPRFGEVVKGMLASGEIARIITASTRGAVQPAAVPGNGEKGAASER